MKVYMHYVHPGNGVLTVIIRETGCFSVWVLSAIVVSDGTNNSTPLYACAAPVELFFRKLL